MSSRFSYDAEFQREPQMLCRSVSVLNKKLEIGPTKSCRSITQEFDARHVVLLWVLSLWRMDVRMTWLSALAILGDCYEAAVGTVCHKSCWCMPKPSHINGRVELIMMRPFRILHKLRRPIAQRGCSGSVQLRELAQLSPSKSLRAVLIFEV